MFALLLTSLAVASPTDRPWSLDLGLVAELPVSTGVQATLELPGRVRLGAGVGRLPGLLVYAASEAGSSSGLLDPEDATVIGDSLGAALVIGGSVGWRPFREAGLWLAGDLRSLRCSVPASPELLATALSVDFDGQGAAKGSEPEELEIAADPYTLSMRATLVGGSVGWDWVLAERVTLRFSAGGLVLRSSTTSVAPGEQVPSVGPEQQLAGQASDGLEILLDRRFFTPTLGLGLGWHFG
jgi:hypothetical protein